MSPRSKAAKTSASINDYFIEAQKDQPPEIKMTRPGRDFKASPDRRSHRRGGGQGRFRPQEGRAALLRERRAGKDRRRWPAGGKTSSGTSTIALEDFKVEPGDVVSMYAARQGRAQDDQHRYVLHRSAAVRTQLHAIPAGRRRWRRRRRRREDQNQISQRQKEIITATWNQVKGAGRARAPMPRTPRSWPACSPNCATRPSRWPTA